MKLGEHFSSVQRLLAHNKGTNDFVFLDSSTILATSGASTDHQNIALWDSLMAPSRANITCKSQEKNLRWKTLFVFPFRSFYLSRVRKQCRTMFSLFSREPNSHFGRKTWWHRHFRHSTKKTFGNEPSTWFEFTGALSRSSREVLCYRIERRKYSSKIIHVKHIQTDSQTHEETFPDDSMLFQWDCTETDFIWQFHIFQCENKNSSGIVNARSKNWRTTKTHRDEPVEISQNCSVRFVTWI